VTFPLPRVLLSFLNIHWTQITSFTAVLRAMYFASVDDAAIELCFFVLHEIAAPLIVATNPKIDL
jgi:hypothetical protein